MTNYLKNTTRRCAMIPDSFDRGYLAALKRIRVEVQKYSEMVTDLEHLDDKDVEIINKTCYDIVDIIGKEIDLLEEF